MKSDYHETAHPFNAILESVRVSDRYQWAIGDALVAQDLEKVLALICERDKTQWTIGDALAKAIPRIEDAAVEKRQFRAVRKMLGDFGYTEICLTKVTVKFLRQLRDVALGFPLATRSDLPWGVHAAAGTPENLKKVVKALREQDWPITPINVEFVMAEWRGETLSPKAAAEFVRAREKAARRC
jgi:hypothetical protein